MDIKLCGKIVGFMIQFDYTFFIVLLGTMLVGITSGIIGCFIILQQESLFGDALAHAALPGLAITFLYTGCKNSSALFIGAIISAGIGAYFILLIHRHTTLKKETSLGIVLSTSFGLGTVLLSVIQRYPTAHKSGIHTFLLGNAATLLFEDLVIISIIAAIVIMTVVACWKEFKILIFDKEFAYSLGIQVSYSKTILTIITIFTIIIGLQTVGAVLISSLLIAPATAAFQWTKKLSSMILLSCLCSCISTTLGTIISSSLTHLPTGPIIIIIATLCTIFSIICAPYLLTIRISSHD